MPGCGYEVAQSLPWSCQSRQSQEHQNESLDFLVAAGSSESDFSETGCSSSPHSVWSGRAGGEKSV